MDSRGLGFLAAVGIGSSEEMVQPSPNIEFPRRGISQRLPSNLYVAAGGCTEREIPPRVIGFQTVVAGVPRTSGVLINLLDFDVDPPIVKGGMHLLGLALPDLQLAHTAAYGKLAVLTKRYIAVFQEATGEAPVPVWCGNATAAGLLTKYRQDGHKRTVCMQVHGRSATLRVKGRVEDDQVEQDWLVQTPVVSEFNWRGKRGARIDALNPYAFIEGPLPPQLTGEQARRELVGDGLDAKLAIINPVTTVPAVTFFNSNGQHGAAPQTGLASMAITALYVEWFARLIESGIEFQTRVGPRIERLPKVRLEGKGSVSVQMPATRVVMHPYFPGSRA